MLGARPLLVLLGLSAVLTKADEFLSLKSGQEGYQVVEGHEHGSLAKSVFRNAINQTGWAYFEVETSGKFMDAEQVS